MVSRLDRPHPGAHLDGHPHCAASGGHPSKRTAKELVADAPHLARSGCDRVVLLLRQREQPRATKPVMAAATQRESAEVASP